MSRRTNLRRRSGLAPEWAGRTRCRAVAPRRASFSPDASLEVSVPSARPNRDALSVGANPSDDPASALLAPSRPARPRTFAAIDLALAYNAKSRRRPCGFSPCECKCGGAWCGTCRALLRRIVAATKRLATHLRSTVWAFAGVAGSIALTSDPSHQALPHYIGRSRAIMHRRVPCSAVFRYRHRTFAAWPIDWSFPQINRRRSWGSVTLRRFAPALGWRAISESPDPRALGHPSSSPIDFRRT